MPPPPRAVPLPPMPLWLRLLGIGVCLAPPAVGLVSLALGVKDVQEFIGSVLYLLVLLSIVILVLTVPLLAPPICWGLGWRPGALVCSGFLAVAGCGFYFGNAAYDRQLSSLLLLHLPLLGLLVWEWRAARRRRVAPSVPG